MSKKKEFVVAKSFRGSWDGINSRLFREGEFVSANELGTCFEGARESEIIKLREEPKSPKAREKKVIEPDVPKDDPKPSAKGRGKTPAKGPSRAAKAIKSAVAKVTGNGEE